MVEGLSNEEEESNGVPATPEALVSVELTGLEEPELGLESVALVETLKDAFDVLATGLEILVLDTDAENTTRVRLEVDETGLSIELEIVEDARVDRLEEELEMGWLPDRYAASTCESGVNGP